MCYLLITEAILTNLFHNQILIATFINPLPSREEELKHNIKIIVLI